MTSRTAVFAMLVLVCAACGGTKAATFHASPSPETAREIVVHATGDVLLDPTQIGLLAASHTAPWTDVKDLFRTDDITMVNLECSPGDGGTRQVKQYTFRCSSRNDLSAMHDAGVDVANMGNNHSNDFGFPALLDGRARLSEAGLHPVGAGHNEAEANSPAVFRRAGKTIAVLGFSRVVPEAAWRSKGDRPGVADGYVIPSMVAAVRAAAATNDLVFVMIHWGNEGEAEPLAEDVDRAHALIDAGAAAVFGHHAHRLQPLRFYKGRPIFFGLGNFVWPRNGPTGIAEVRISPNGAMTACLMPATITSGRPALARSRC